MRYIVESFVEEENAWVIETERTDEKAAKEDAALLRMFDKKVRVSESQAS